MTKKNRVPVNLGRYKAFAKYDGKGLEKLYNEWKSATKALSGTSIGFNRYKGNLFNYIEQHGIAPRVMGNSGPKGISSEEKEFGSLIDAVEAMVNKRAFDVDQIREIIKTYNIMTKMNRDNQSDDNPRNIMFTDHTSWDEDNGLINSRGDKPVYGHYITDNYINRRKDYNKVAGRKKKSIPKAPSGYRKWHNYEKGKAEPPYWQYTLGPKGLRVVLREALKTMKDITYDIEDPILIDGNDRRYQGAGEYAYRNFAEVNRYFKKIFAKNSIDDYITPMGNISSTKIENQLKDIKITAENNAENEQVKEWMKAEGLPGTVKTFYIRISRRQVENIAKKYFEKNFEAALEARKEKEESNVNKSWRQVLAW